MSLLDTIKGLLCKLMADKPGSEQKQENKAPEAATPTPEVKPEPVAEPEVKPEPVVEQKPAHAPVAKKEPVPSKVVTKQTASLQIPEDSTLKRHFLSALKVEVEISMGPRPTDSTLKRHYDAAVQAEVDNLLG